MTPLKEFLQETMLSNSLLTRALVKKFYTFLQYTSYHSVEYILIISVAYLLLHSEVDPTIVQISDKI